MPGIYCPNCFQELREATGRCPNCDHDMTADLGKYPFALPYGSVLAGQYITGRVLGQGGFGITYLAWDDRLKTRVAIKEFLPDTMAVRAAGSPQITVYTGQRQENFQYGMERFLDEAKVLAKFQGDPRIVGVQSYFEENGTAYFVMDYVEGTSLKAYIQSRGGKLPWEEAVGLLTPVMDALDAVHREGIIHRDVTPDNIFLTSGGGVKLLDFGSARYSLGDRSRSLDVVLKAGYAPKEQYTRRGRQGPYTDVYSLAACLYAAITGYLPPESLDRVDEDELVLPSTRGIRLPQAVEDVLLKGLEVQPADRYQTMGEFRQALDAARTPAEAPVPPPPEPEPEKETAPESTAPAEKAVKPVEGKTERKTDRGLPRAAKWSFLAAGFCAVLLIGLAVGGVFTRPTDSGSAAPVANMAAPEALVDHPDGTPEETAGSESLVVVTLTASDVQELADLHGKLIGISVTNGPAGVVYPEAYEEASALYGDENLLLVDTGDAGVMDHLRSGACDAAIMDARAARELADGSPNVRILDTEWTAEAARQGMEASPADTDMEPETAQEPIPVTEPMPVQEPVPDTGAKETANTQESGRPPETVSPPAPTQDPPVEKPVPAPVEVSKPSEGDLKEKARTHRENSQWKEAAACYQQLYDLGYIGKSEAAEYIFQRALEAGNSMKGNYDLALKVELLRQSADLGEKRAMSELGDAYYYGRGVEINNTSAVQWWEKAAALGDDYPYYYLGLCYEMGRGVPQNDETAFQWYLKDAQTNGGISMLNVAECYKDGKGVAKDTAQAIAWYEKFLEGGDGFSTQVEEAQTALDELRSQAG